MKLYSERFINIYLLITSIELVVCSDDGCNLDNLVLTDLGDKIQVCSRNLACLIRQFCDCKVNFFNKETNTTEILSPAIMEEHKMVKRRSIKRRRRMRRSIVEECCTDQCTIVTILSYCPENSMVLENGGTCEEPNEKGNG